eukprot:1148355-Pelagomonas_calceolata.AAC.5
MDAHMCSCTVACGCECGWKRSGGGWVGGLAVKTACTTAVVVVVITAVACKLPIDVCSKLSSSRMPSTK